MGEAEKAVVVYYDNLSDTSLTTLRLFLEKSGFIPYFYSSESTVRLLEASEELIENLAAVILYNFEPRMIHAWLFVINTEYRAVPFDKQVKFFDMREEAKTSGIDSDQMIERFKRCLTEVKEYYSAE